MYRRICLALGLLVCAPFASAQLSIATHAASAGLGIELGYRTPAFGVRGGNLSGNLNFDFKAEDTDGIEGDELRYDSDISLRNIYLLTDWHPYAGRFRLSAGLLFNYSDAQIVTRCEATSPLPGTASCEFGDSRFSPAVLGEIHTDIDFEPVAPYLGLGWAHKPNQQLSFTADLGVAYLGSANVKMHSTGTCNDSETCRQEIEREADEVKSELEDFKLLPVIRVGIGYSF
jgi:hypothetical protein